VARKQRFKDHLCPHLQGTDLSGESVRVWYKPAWVPCSWLRQAYVWHGLILQIHQYPEDEDRDGPWNAVFSPLNQLTRLVAQEYFIIQCRRESYKSYTMSTVLSVTVLLGKVHISNKICKLLCIVAVHIQECIKKFPDWVINKIYAYLCCLLLSASKYFPSESSISATAGTDILELRVSDWMFLNFTDIL
jgi:hypothetical protein